MVDVRKIIAEGLAQLQKRTFGGVTPESAEVAIRNAVQEVQRQMEEVARLGVQEVNRKNAQNMEKLTQQHLAELAQKDAQMASFENRVAKAETKATKANAKLKEGLKYKEIETLPDGSKVYERHTHRGTVAKATFNPDNKKVQENIQLADGTFYRTTFNPETGKPTRLITNKTKNGETVEIKYDGYGQVNEERVLNVKKSKTPKAKEPKIVKQEIIEKTKDYIWTRNTLSDGQIMEIQKSLDGKTLSWAKKFSNGIWTEYYEKSYDGTITRRKQFVKNGEWHKTQKIKFPSGIEVTFPYKSHTDELTGLVTDISRWNYPKSSDVKFIESHFPEGRKLPTKSVVKMKDGTVYELSNFKVDNSDTIPSEIIKTLKDGTKSKIIVNSNDKINKVLEWLESFHPEYNMGLQKKLPEKIQNL